MKTINKVGAYKAPMLREMICTVEAGFAASVPTNSYFDDLTFEGRENE